MTSNIGGKTLCVAGASSVIGESVAKLRAKFGSNLISAAGFAENFRGDFVRFILGGKNASHRRPCSNLFN